MQDQIITSIPKSELVDAIRTSLLPAIENLLLEHSKNKFTDKEYLTVRETSEYLGMSHSSIYNWIDAGKLTKHMIKGRVRFLKKEIDKSFKKIESKSK